MVVAPQPIKKQEKQLTEEEIDKMIKGGGRSMSKENQPDTKSVLLDCQNDPKVKKEIKFTVRIPKNIIARMDKLRSKRAAKPSRNNWILDVIEKALDEAEKIDDTSFHSSRHDDLVKG